MPRGTGPKPPQDHASCELKLRLAKSQGDKALDAALEHLLKNEEELSLALDVIESLISLDSTVVDVRKARTFLKKHNRKWRV